MLQPREQTETPTSTDTVDSIVAERKARIRDLNDKMRRQPLLAALCGLGRTVMAAGIAAKSEAEKQDILWLVRTFNAFDEDNDPWAEHDFGAVEYKGERIFWKIDYFDRDYQFASPDPSDVAYTCRVLTILLASEY